MRKVILWVELEEYWLVLETLGVSGVSLVGGMVARGCRREI